MLGCPAQGPALFSWRHIFSQLGEKLPTDGVPLQALLSPGTTTPPLGGQPEAVTGRCKGSKAWPLCLHLGQFRKDSSQLQSSRWGPPRPLLEHITLHLLTQPLASTPRRCCWEHASVNLLHSNLHMRVHFSGNLTLDSQSREKPKDPSSWPSVFVFILSQTKGLVLLRSSFAYTVLQIVKNSRIRGKTPVHRLCTICKILFSVRSVLEGG